MQHSLPYCSPHQHKGESEDDGKGNGEFDAPYGIACGADGNIFVSDLCNSPDGTCIRLGIFEKILLLDKAIHPTPQQATHQDSNSQNQATEQGGDSPTPYSCRKLKARK